MNQITKPQYLPVGTTLTQHQKSNVRTLTVYASNDKTIACTTNNMLTVYLNATSLKNYPTFIN